MKVVFKVLVLWVMLLALPLQGFAWATMSLCALPVAAAQHAHGQELTGSDADACDSDDQHVLTNMQTEDHSTCHHHSSKCSSCVTCGSCVSMAPLFIAVMPLATSPFFIVSSVDQDILPSVDLALPERPPRI